MENVLKNCHGNKLIDLSVKEVNSMTDNKEIDLFCIDCDTITRQKYKGILSDGSHLYICKECGCENTTKENV